MSCLYDIVILCELEAVLVTDHFGVILLVTGIGNRVGVGGALPTQES